MTDEHIRELIGRYASGELTEQERKVLFSAALHDQDLFDELADEHAVKQLLDEPGVKARMLASLAPAAEGGGWSWTGKWAWLAGSAAALILVAIIAVAVLRQRPPKEIAELQTSPVTGSPAPVIESAAPPVPRTKESSRLRLPKQPGTQAVQSLVPAEREAKIDIEATAAPPETPKKAKTAGTLAPPAPVPQVFAPRVSSFRDGNQTAALSAASARFSFDYEITLDRKLRIIPSAMGFLVVNASSGTSAASLAENLFSRAGMAIEFAIPPEATLLTVVFSAQPVSRDAMQPNLAGSLDPPSGTKIDPNPSSDSRLSAIIQIRAAGVR